MTDTKKLYKVNIDFDYIIEENTLFLKAGNETEAIETAKWYLINPGSKEEIQHYKSYSFDCAKMNENNIEVKELNQLNHIKNIADIHAMIEAIHNGTFLEVN